MKYSQDMVDLNFFFNKTKSDLKLCLILLTKNNNSPFDSQMQQLSIKQALRPYSNI